MLSLKLFRWPLLLIVFCLLGCASLQVQTSQTLTWESVSTVAVQEPAHDRWELAPAIHAELETMGVDVLSDASANPDLLFRFFTKEVEDLDHEANRTLRLASFHMEVIDPNAKAVVGTLDFFYPEGEGAADPEDGVEAAFAGLRKRIAAKHRAQPEADTPVQQRDETKVSIEPRPSEPIAPPTPDLPAPEPSEPEQVDNEQEPKGSLEVVPPKTVRPKTAEMPEPASGTRSPWIPRLQTWGFDTWGEEGDDED